MYVSMEWWLWFPSPADIDSLLPTVDDTTLGQSEYSPHMQYSYWVPYYEATNCAVWSRCFCVLVYMWQSHLEIEHYSVSIKNELTVLIKTLGLPPRHAQVSALFVACTSSYNRESAFHLGGIT